MTASTEQIREKAREIVLQHPAGIRYTDLFSSVRQALPNAVDNTVTGQIARLVASYPNELTKPSRGLYKPLLPGEIAPPVKPSGPGLQREEEVYEPFAKWLKNDIEEATEAAALGGAGLRRRWATPDVVGVYRPLAAELIKFSPEIVAAEIKLDPDESIVAFGQAIAYRLFATRTYIVMPSTMAEEDQTRLESLSLLFGVGFVLFDPSLKPPRFEIRVRAQRFSPDMFYVNEFASRLHALDAERFQLLFG